MFSFGANMVGDFACSECIYRGELYDSEYIFFFTFLLYNLDGNERRIIKQCTCGAVKCLYSRH